MEDYIRYMLGLGPNTTNVEQPEDYPMDFFLGEDEDGVITFEADFGPNPPDVLIQLESKISEAVDKIRIIGNMDPEDIQTIVSQQFLDVLGPPNHTEDFIEEGLALSNVGWDLPGGGSIFKYMEREAKPTEKLDKDSIEYKKVQLKEALQKEDYSKATELRDEIKGMEKLT